MAAIKQDNGVDSSSDNKINMNVAMMSARALGINGPDISDDTGVNATGAIDTIASALRMDTMHQTT